MPMAFGVDMRTSKGTGLIIVLMSHEVVQALQDKDLKHQGCKKKCSHRAIWMVLFCHTNLRFSPLKRLNSFVKLDKIGL